MDELSSRVLAEDGRLLAWFAKQELRLCWTWRKTDGVSVGEESTNKRD
jgi:hypothetical protein